jgi:D-serine deaminase-like pyridoxal phosphate-dependent protein
MNVHELPTPALLLDADAFDSNIAQMAAFAAASGKQLRPHAKAHKCVAVAKRQIAAGAIGVCAATVPEAELMVKAGIRGVLLTSPIADPRKMARMAALARIAPDTTVVLDHPAQMRLYAAAALIANVTLNVLIDLDVGDHRTGILPGAPALELAEGMVRTPALRFTGLQAYSVRASHTSVNEGRRDFTRNAWQCAVETQALLRRHGIVAPILTGGSTGSYQADATVAEVTELQAGSYVYMDEAYTRIGEIPFVNAMTVMATVVSATHSDKVTVDAGFKAFSTDRPFGPRPIDPQVARYDWAGDEFGYVHPEEGSRGPKLGDRLRFIPPHCDPTVNLYRCIHVCRGETVMESWPIGSDIIG